MSKLDEQRDSGNEVVFEGKVHDKTVKFAAKVVSAECLTSDDFDAAGFGLDDGDLVLVTVRVTNLGTKSRSAYYVRDTFVLLDEDGAEHLSVNPDSFESDEQFVENYNVKRFSGWSDVPPLRPKIAAAGVLAYLVPKGAYDSLQLAAVDPDDAERDEWL